MQHVFSCRCTGRGCQMRALICHQAQPQWKTLCMIKPQRVFLMQRMSSRGSAVGGDLPVLQQFTSVHMELCCWTGCPAAAPWGVANSTPVLSAVVVGAVGSKQARSLWLCAGPQVKLTVSMSLDDSLLQRQTHSVNCISSRSMTSPTVNSRRVALDQ